MANRQIVHPSDGGESGAGARPAAADGDESVGRDRLDELMVQMARGRVAIGVAAFLAPGPAMRLLGLGGGDAGRDLVTRMYGAREIALGAGYLLSGRSGRKTWAQLGLLVDSLDAVSGVRSRRDLPIWVAAGTSTIAGGAAALGAAKVAKDLIR